MKSNGHKPPSSTTANAPATDLPKQDLRVTNSLDEMETTIRLQTLSDLELIAEVLENDQRSLDPLVYELLSRLYPDWSNEPSFQTLPRVQRFISVAVPFAVADSFATFSECHCDQSFAPTPEQNRPCVYCAIRTALYKNTKNPVYQPDDDNSENQSSTP